MKQTAQSILSKARKLMKKKGLTLDEVGVRMGYKPGSARRSVWQIFHETPDPRFSTLARLAQALEVPLRDLL